jgi:hypothetical protein
MPIEVDPATIRGVLALIDDSGRPDHPEATRFGKEMADLRAQVEALPVVGVKWHDDRKQMDGLLYRADVLALIDGSSE